MSTIAAGTTTTTALVNTGDTTGNLVFQTNGTTTAMTIDTSQNVGVNTSTPNSIGGNSNAKYFGLAGDGALDSADGRIILSNPRAYASIVANSTTAGRVYFQLPNTSTGTTAQAAFIDSIASGSGGTSGYGIDIRFGPKADNGASSERMRLDSSGNLLVGTTSATSSSRLRLKGSGSTSSTVTAVIENSAGTQLLYARDDGFFAIPSTYNNTNASAANVWMDGSGFLYRSTSSLKYKTDVQNATHGLAEVMALRSVTYKGKNSGDTVFGGLIAEEVHEAGLTEFVQYAKDGSPDALHYGNMVSVLVKSIQEQQAMITQLQAEVAALKGAQ